jgi:8-oxo-dGTP diphosphatase
MRDHVVVTAAVIERDGAFLIARRPAGVHLAGLWEFPGGKCDPGETLRECLSREILEELGCGVVVGEEIYRTSHDYPERTVQLHFFDCRLEGEPAAKIGQELRWVPRAALSSLSFPPADHQLIERLSR